MNGPPGSPVGFTARPETYELAALAKERGLTLIHDLGSGSLVRLAELGTAEPTVADCLKSGADLVTFSGDKLLGGPQAGIVVGRTQLVDSLRGHAFARACRIDKLSLAALALPVFFLCLFVFFVAILRGRAGPGGSDNSHGL